MLKLTTYYHIKEICSVPKKEPINEIFIFRTIACLAIVLLHSFSSAKSKFGDTLSVYQSHIIDGFSMILMFGTPMFVFITEFLLSKSYPNKLPPGFFKKRAKFLLLPYTFMGIVYAFLETESYTLSSLLILIFRHIFLAEYTGYFIIIVFQFYLLHVFMQKYGYRWSAKKMLIGAFLFNVFYLAFFNYVPAPNSIPYSGYLWSRSSWMIFFAWIFYFFLGYYCGKNYREISSIIKPYKHIIITGLIFSVILVVSLQYFGLPEATTSKRADILIYTSLLILFILNCVAGTKHVSKLFYFISNYSFSIFLLHKVFMHFFEYLPLNNIAIYIPIVFATSVFLSISVAYVMNLNNYGKYIVGNVQTYKSEHKEKHLLQKNNYKNPAN